ncbi:MAG: hypothetical protein WCH46_05995 [bacterium]
MTKICTACFLFIGSLFFSVTLRAQELYQQRELPTNDLNSGIHLNYSVGDTNFLPDLLKGKFLDNPLKNMFRFRDSSDEDLWSFQDSTDDSLLLDLKVGDYAGKRRHHRHSFLITEPAYDREIPHLESLPFMDFNRVNGYYLGIATPGMADFGPHQEFGIKGGIGYGFEEKKGQSQLGGEFRIPIGKNDTSIAVERWRLVPTIALGAEYHNVTTTEDAWRTQRGENAAYAFLVREDFRDYFKIEGWNAYVAFRPEHKSELRVEYRSDIYYNQPQRVFHGRFGGGKDLPSNPTITQGRMNEWVVTAGHEDAKYETVSQANFWGDTVSYRRMNGWVTLLQTEFGTNVGADSSYQRYIFDLRNFNPICPGLSFDTRFRMESSTGDAPFQKLEFIGGPSSLPALKNRIIGGNRLVLLNTELRFSLAALSTFFKDSPELIILNDFGFCKRVRQDNNLLQGFGDITFSTIAYNIGIGIGHPEGVQIGVSFRTDIKEAGRFFFRFQRPF